MNNEKKLDKLIEIMVTQNAILRNIERQEIIESYKAVIKKNPEKFWEVLSNKKFTYTQWVQKADQLKAEILNLKKE